MLKKIVLASSLLAASSAVYAGTASETYFELGVGYGHFYQNGDSVADLNIWRGVFNYTISGDAPLLIADIRTTWEYATKYSNDDQHYLVGNVEAVLGVSVLSIIKAYAFAGPELSNYHSFDYLPNKYTDSDWNLGVTYGAAVEIEALPGLLHITPYVRTSHVDEMDRVRYGLDTSFWFTWVGVGADISYQDYRGGADAESWQACIYAGLRF